MFQRLLAKPIWILFFACTSMFALGLADNIRGPLFAELIHYFKLSNTEASLSFATTSAFGFLGSLFVYKILKRISLDQALVQCLLLMSIGLFVMGIGSTYLFYLLGAAIFGFSMGLLGVTQNLIVAENFHGSQQTKALSGLHGLYGFSSLLAPFLASMAPHYLGVWRGAFFMTSAISLFVFSLSFVLKTEKILEARFDKDDTLNKTQNPTKKSLLAVGGILAFYVVAEILVSTRLALYMRQYFQMNLEESSLYVSYFFIFLLIGRLIFSFITLKISLKKQLNYLLLLSFLMLALGLKFHPLFLAMTGLTMAPFYPLSLAYISEQTKEHKRSFITFAIGFQNFCIIVMHMGVGYITDQLGLKYAFAVGLFALFISFGLLNTHHRVHS